MLDTQTPILGLELSGGPDRAPPRDWLVNYFPVRRPDGSLRGVGATLVDITDRNRAQAQIRELEARQAQDRFRSALDIMRDSVAIDSAIRDDTGRIVDFRIEYLNPVVHDLGGRTRDQLMGATMLELWPEMAGSELFESYIRAVETGEAFIGREVAQRITVDGEERRRLLRPAGAALRRRAAHLLARRHPRARGQPPSAEATIELAVEHRIVERLQQALLPAHPAPRRPASRSPPATTRWTSGPTWAATGTTPSACPTAGSGCPSATSPATASTPPPSWPNAGWPCGPTPTTPPRHPPRLRTPPRCCAGSTSCWPSHPPPSWPPPSTPSTTRPSGQLRWARAGHPLPLVCGPVTRGTPRRVRELEATGGPPLGTRLIDDYPSCETRLDPDAFVLFYTDGLVERRGHLIDDGVDEVKARLEADDWDALPTLCDALTESVRAGLTREDDVCILALRRNPLDDPASPVPG